MRSRTGISSKLKRKKKTIRRQARRAERCRVFAMESLEERRVLSVAPWGTPDDFSAAAVAGPYQVAEDHIVTADGATIFLDPAAPAAPAQGNGGGSVNPVPFPLDDTFTLHSLPSATKRIYLDFNGFTTTGTEWNSQWTGGADIVSSGYDIGGDLLTTTDTELGRIQLIWEQVSEDYAPFNVDVTTEEPTLDQLTNSGGDDDSWGIRVVIGNGDWFNLNPLNPFGAVGGITRLGSFSDGGDTPCFVFPEGTGNGDAKDTAEAIAHEVGHSLGLKHDGVFGVDEDGNTVLIDYYPGSGGTGPTSWAPIMGAGYYSNVVQWSKGEYTGASNQEDDLAIITSGLNGFGYRADDFGDTPADAAPLARGGDGVFQTGVIETRDDVDVFSLNTLDGDIDLHVAPFLVSPNLDIQATLYDADGNVVLTDNPLDALDAALQITVAPGTYYVAVEGVGVGDPLTTGYSDYGSLGQYTITGHVNSPPSVLLGSISGTLWSDASNDGVRGPSEAGVANAMIYLDLNLNGRIDVDEPATRTDQDGRYHFQVAPGQYTVRQVVTPGWVQTAPVDPLGGSGEGFGNVVVVDLGEAVTDVDFGNFHLADDYGTAPAPYPTSPAAGGAAAQNLPGFQLGADGYLDDGVRFLTGLHAGRTEQLLVQASYNNYPSAYLQGWIDFNGDGDWSDPGEQIVTNFTLVEGSNTVSFQVPSGVNVNPNATQWARFRFGYEYNFGPTGLAMAGEVEDYPVQFPQAPDTGMTAGDDAYNLDEDDPATTLDVLVNDSLGPGGGNLQIISIDAASVDGSLEIAPDGSHLIYQPRANFFGTETFSYAVEDGRGGLKTADVVIHVASVNDPPVAVEDSFDIDLDTSDNPLNVLSNDTDVDGDVLQVSGFTNPAHGTLFLQSNGSLQYTPDPGYAGADSFTYTVSDGADTDTATVALNVAQLPDLVRFRLQAVDENGVPITSANVGDTFTLQVYVQDLRGVSPEGVYSAFLDLNYDDDLMHADSTSLAGGPEYNAIQNGVGGSFATSGLIDEVGGIADTGGASNLDGAEYPLFSVNFTADAAGVADFTSDAADFGLSQTLLFDHPGVVGDTRIQFDALDNFEIIAFGALPDEFTVTQGEQDVILDVLANDQLGADGGAKQIAGVASGTVDVTNNGDNLSYSTPDSGFTGDQTFTYTFTDGQGNTDTAQVTVHVVPPNNKPVAMNDGATVVEDSTDNLIDVLANDFDERGILELVDPGSPAHGAVSVNADNKIEYTPDADYFGTDSFTYTVTDGTPGHEVTATVNVIVQPVNDLPAAAADRFAVNEDGGQISLAVLANDSFAPDAGETLSIASFTAGSEGGALQIAPGGQSLLYTPAPNFNGTETFTYTINDGTPGSNATATVVVAVDPLDDGPPTANDDHLFIDRNSANNTLNVLANDSLGVDLNETLTITGVQTAPHGFVTVAADGESLIYTPALNYLGFDTFEYTIEDGSGNAATATVTVWVEPTTFPKARPDWYSVTQGGADNVLDVLDNDLAGPGGALFIVGHSTPDHGQLTLDAQGRFHYRPDANFIGADTFTYTVDNGVIGSTPATTTVTIDVREVQDLVRFTFATYDLDGNPIDEVVAGQEFVLKAFVEDIRDETLGAPAVGVYSPYLDLLYDSGLISAVGSIQHGSDYQNAPSGTVTPGLIDEVGGQATNGLNNPPLGGGQYLVFSQHFQAGGTLGTADFSGNLADQAIHQMLLFSYGGGAVTPAEVRFVDAQVEIVDFAGVDDAYTVIQDSNSSDNHLPVLDNDRLGAAGGALRILGVTNDNDGPGIDGTVTINGDELLYAPAPGFVGDDTFTYTVTDDLGHNATVTVTVHVVPPNDPPVAVDDSATVAEDSSNNPIDVLTNDFDERGILEIVDPGSPAHGAVTVNADNKIEYTPDADYFGTDSFTYTINDGTTGHEVTATVNVTILPVNDSPTAAADAFAVNEDGGPVSLAVLTNDSFAPDAGETLSIASFTAGSEGGALQIAPGGQSLLYTPKANFNGTETFTYTINDGTPGGNATAMVTVIVDPVDDGPPTAGDDNLFVDRNVGQSDPGASLDVLANDSVGVDLNETLTVIGFDAAPAHGTVTTDGESVTYTPALNYLGFDTFKYTIDDGSGNQATATVTVWVEPATFPKARPDHYLLDQNAGDTVLDVLDNDLAGPGGTLFIVGHSTPAHGQLTLDAQGQLHYTPDPGFAGAYTDTFAYTVDNGLIGGAPATTAVTIDVREVQDLVEFTLVTTDLDGNPIDHVLAGDSFLVQVLVEDIRDETLGTPALGVYSPYLDLLYDSGLVSAVGSIQHGSDYQNAPSGAVTPGLIDEVGGQAAAANQPLDGLQHLVFTLQFQAGDTVGTADFSGKLADQAIHQMLLFSHPGAVEPAEVHFVGGQIEIVDFGARDDEFTVAGGSTAAVLDVLDNDEQGGSASVTITVGTPDQGGAVTVNANNELEYTPAVGFAGGDETFTYEITDDDGNTSTATVTVHVADAGSLPVANNDTATVVQGTGPVTIDVLANDTASPGATLTIALPDSGDPGGPLHGTVAVNANNELEYTPTDPTFNGVETFTYTIHDSVSGNDATATVNVTVQLTTLPEARDDEVFGVQEDGVAVPLTDLLDNDDVNAGGTKQIIVVGNFDQGGSAMISPDGATIRYTPAADFFGTETFTYTLHDGVGPDAVATVTVHVSNVNDPPTAIDDAQTVRFNAADVVLDVLANDTFAPDVGETLTITAPPLTDAGGTLTVIDGGARLSYDAPIGFSGVDSFEYTVSDGHGGVATATVTLTVADQATMAVDLKLVDQNGVEINSPVSAGTLVTLQVFVEDLRSSIDPDQMGVTSAYVDVAFDPAVAAFVPGSVVHDTSIYGLLANDGDLASGELKNVGSVWNAILSTGSVPPPGPGSKLLFSVNFTVSAGDVVFSVNPPEAPDNPQPLGVFAEPVANDDIFFGQVELHVTPDTAPAPPAFTNAANPYDANADGHLSPIDALSLIDILRNGGENDLYGHAVTASGDGYAAAAPYDATPPRPLDYTVTGLYVDVNDDGRFSPIDVLMVIDQLRRLTGESAAAPLAAPALDAAAPTGAPRELPPSAPAAVAQDAPTAATDDFSWGVAAAAAPTQTTAEPTAATDAAGEETAAPTAAHRPHRESALAPADDGPMDEDVVDAIFGSEERDDDQDDELEGILADIADEVAVAWRE